MTTRWMLQTHTERQLAARGGTKLGMSARLLMPLMVSCALLSNPAAAIVEEVTAIDPFSATPTLGVWFESDIRLAGAAGITDLTGLGGNLESNAPSPDGALLLTTTSDNGDKAEIAVPGGYGRAGDVIDASLQLAYAYYKEASGNAFAAPTLKLTFFNSTSPCPSADGDCFMTLVYEPTWNQVGSVGSSVSVPTGDWEFPAIDQSTGVFWSTGGFGTGNGAGGPPLNTLADWLATLDPAFADADLIGIGVGVGTFNQDQIGYFDEVSLFATGPVATDVTWDFEPPSAPGGLGVFVDLSAVQGPAPVQAGYVGVDGLDAADGTPVVVSGLDISLSSGGTESGGTGINGRDRGALAAGQALSDLARDFAFAWGEDLLLTIGGLEAGIYEWTGYLHDIDRDQGVATISLSTDGGSSYAYGPTPASHSTTDDPERIETHRIRFYTDGAADVVVRISNSDLPAPQVRPILNAFDLRDAEPLVERNVDFFEASHSSSPVQDGYVAVDASDASDGTPVDVAGVGVALASGGTEVGGSGVTGLDRGALDASQPLSDLARDFAFALGEELILTLEDVEAGSYVWTGYFHDRNRDQGDAEISVSTDGGTTFGPAIVFNHSTGTDPMPLATVTLDFQTDGSAPVVVKISNSDLPSPSVRPILDGFDLGLFARPGIYTRVDMLDSAQGVSPTQVGFVAVDLDDSTGGASVDLAIGRLSITSSGAGGPATDGRDRGALAPGQGKSDLMRDFVFGLGENLDLTFENLAPGSYVFSGVFHDSDVDHGAADLLASVDGGSTFPFGPNTFDNSTGSDPSETGYGSIVFTANGVDPVVVRIANPDAGQVALVNGFAISVPEPSTLIGLISGVGLLSVLARIRHR